MLAVIFSFAVSSCDKNDSLLESQIESKDVASEELLKEALDAESSTRSTQSWFSELVQNWSIESTGSGVALLKKRNDSEDTYIVLANLRQGAKVGMVFDQPTNSGTSNAAFTKKSLSSWNSYGSFFAIANSVFFDANGGNPCVLPFPLKQDGVMYTYGTGGSNLDKRKQKAVLNIYGNYADIIPIGVNPMNYSPMNSSSKSYAGFYENVGNSEGIPVGRTLVGIKDSDGDGQCEYVILLVASSKTQTQAYNLLKYGSVSCNKVITFDGGGSSQLRCPSKSSSALIPGDGRSLPATIVIKER